MPEVTSGLGSVRRSIASGASLTCPTVPPSTAQAFRSQKKPRRTFLAAAPWSFAGRSSGWPTGLLPPRYSSRGFVVCDTWSGFVVDDGQSGFWLNSTLSTQHLCKKVVDMDNRSASFKV